MAETLEDVLARRTRALFLNARAAIEIAGTTAAITGSRDGQIGGMDGEGRPRNLRN